MDSANPSINTDWLTACFACCKPVGYIRRYIGDVMNKMNLILLLAVAVAPMPLYAAAESSTLNSSYKKSVYEQTYSTLRQLLTSSPDAKGKSAEEISTSAANTAAALTECHMISMNAYSPSLQKTAFDVIQRGGTYADSKMAFDTALAAELAMGGIRQKAAQSMIERSVDIGKRCISKHNIAH